MQHLHQYCQCSNLPLPPIILRHLLLDTVTPAKRGGPYNYIATAGYTLRCQLPQHSHPSRCMQSAVATCPFPPATGTYCTRLSRLPCKPPAAHTAHVSLNVREMIPLSQAGTLLQRPTQLARKSPSCRAFTATRACTQHSAHTRHGRDTTAAAAAGALVNGSVLHSC